MSSLITPANTAYVKGTIIGQIVEFSGEKVIHKASLNLTVNNTKRTLIIIGSDGIISFQAANFQRSHHSWAFQPILHWVDDLETSGTMIRNTLQNTSFNEEDDALANAPFLGYDLYFPSEGVYDLWGYGYIDSGGIYWSFSGDSNNLRTLNLGQQQSGWYEIPRWTQFGEVFIPEAGVYKFDIYLKDKNTIAILDQWYFTTNLQLANDLTSEGAESFVTPIVISYGPFNTALRLRNLNGGSLDDLENPYIQPPLTTWLPSINIIDSGKANYEIKNNENYSGVSFVDGLSMEFWQIGGDQNYFAAWDFSFPETTVGSTFNSANFGQSFS